MPIECRAKFRFLAHADTVERGNDLRGVSRSIARDRRRADASTSFPDRSDADTE